MSEMSVLPVAAINTTWFDEIPVVSVWWVVAWGVVSVVLIIVSIFLRPRKWLFVTLPLLVVSLALSVMFALNYQYAYYQNLGQVLGRTEYTRGQDSQLARPTGNWPDGLLITTSIPGSKSGLDKQKALVWLPPEYFTSSDQQFPVIYLLHGVPGVAVPGVVDDSGPDSWFDSLEVEKQALKSSQDGRPVILVAPVVSPMSQDTECVDGAQGNWQTYLATDVPNWVSQWPRMKQGAANTALAGYSMGGTCALVTALRNPDDFSIAVNMSGSPKPTYGGHLSALYGTEDFKEIAATYDSTHIVQTQPASHSVRIWLEIGTRDENYLQQELQQFAQVATAAGMDVVNTSVPGGHDFETWAYMDGQWMPWAAALLYGAQPPQS